mgnify:CR=1 FL=1
MERLNRDPQPPCYVVYIHYLHNGNVKKDTIQDELMTQTFVSRDTVRAVPPPYVLAYQQCRNKRSRPT